MTPDAPVQIDLQRLRQTARECGWSVAEFVDFYAPRARAEFAEVERAHAAGDAEALARTAHGAAGSSASVGATSLSDRYREVEQRVRRGADPAAGLAALGAHLEHVLAALGELVV